MTGGETGGVVFRVDGSKELGLGHVVRCLNVADALRIEPGHRARGIPIRFVVRDDQGARSILEGSDFGKNAMWITQSDDDIERLRAILHELEPSVIVTDIDLRDRVDEYVGILPEGTRHVSLHEHNFSLLKGDLVIAPTIRPMEIPAGGKAGVTHFSGPEYILLPPGLSDVQRRIAMRRYEGDLAIAPRMVLATMGGSDPGRLTYEVAKAIRAYNEPNVEWKVILGPASGYDRRELAQRFAGPLSTAADRGNDTRIEFVAGVEVGRARFLEELASADVVITNGGTTLYEALALGRAAIAIPQNDFEAEVIDLFVKAGACVTPSEAVSAAILETMSGFFSDGHQRKNVSEKGREMIDGRGAGRVAHMIAAYPKPEGV